MQQYVGRQRQLDIWDRIWYDDQGNVVIFQRPNIWLIAWAVTDIVSLFTSGHASNILWWVGTGLLIIWSGLEIVLGVNYFRRALGLLVLVLAVAAAFKIGL